MKLSIKKELIVLCALFFLLTAISCQKQAPGNGLDFDSTPVISAQDRFALVIEPYISFRDQPGPTGITMAHGRRGEIYELQGKKILTDEDGHSLWVHLLPGWVTADSVLLYSNRERAQRAAAELD